MKIRMKLNNNADRVQATVYENAKKVVVRKLEGAVIFDESQYEIIEFDTIADFESWLNAQEWVRLVKKVSSFAKVPA